MARELRKAVVEKLIRQAIYLPGKILMHSNNVIPVAGFPVVRTTARELSEHLMQQVTKRGKTALFFANTNFVVCCRHLLHLMNRDDVMIVNDGVGLDIAVRFIYRNFFNENLAGSDFVPYFFHQSATPLRVFMLGTKPAVLARAARHAREVLHQSVVGTCDGYDGIRNVPDLIETINQTKAHVLMVALGNPVQEEWVLRHLDDLNVNVVMAVGAMFDFWGGDKPRAPRLIRRLRFEWLFRLCLEPRRLMARYTVDFVRFLVLCRRYR
jgi:beta-1,4-glucosyltransferase